MEKLLYVSMYMYIWLSQIIKIKVKCDYFSTIEFNFTGAIVSML